MPIKRDYSDHAEILIMIQEVQDAEREKRAHVKEAKLFLTVRDGQWDPDSITKMDNRFRGTFDMCTPIVDGISGEIDQADFSLRVSPSGGRASEDTAKTIDGLIRNIRNISNAEHVFNKAGRSNVVGGFDAWEVVQDWVDSDTFDQDLFIRWIPNASDSCWWDLASTEQDRSDANWAIKLVTIPMFDYKARWPDGGGMSIGDNAHHNHRINQNTNETVTVGQLYFRKRTTIELVRMTDGSVYEDNEDFKSVQDDLAQQNPPITIEVDNDGEEKRRKRKSWRVWSRMLDGADWLAEEEETVFDFIPLIPIYGNFDIIDNEVVYFGAVEKLIDSQRILNYALSRDIEDGALSPAPTTWMTDAQASGNDYSKMNTDRDPVRIYNNDPEAKTPPFRTGGPEPSTGLQTTIANAQQMITTSSNTFNAQQGNASSTQSGVAGLQQIEQGNIGSIKWFKALEVAICYTGKVIINALPRVYDGTRQSRILSEDGTSSIVTLNQSVFDQQENKNVILNDLSIGEYDVVCEMGPAFNSAQKEAVKAQEDLFSTSPEVASRNMDILLSNKNDPGSKLMAERERAVLFQGGQIPESQWTDEERQQVQQAQAQAKGQEQQPDPLLLAAQAEMVKGQADQQNAANKQQEIQGRQQIEVAKIQLDNKKVDLDIAKFQREKDDKLNVEATKLDQSQQKIDMSQEQMVITAQQNQDKIDLQTQEQRMAQQQQRLDNALKIQQEQREELTTAVNALQGIIAASGADVVLGPHLSEGIVNQAVAVTEVQEESGANTEIGKEVAGTEGG